MTPTTEQLSILDAAAGTANLMINALAGTGKSATLKLIDRANGVHPALYLVFNKRNQLEAIEAQKSGEFAPTTTIKTFNGLGHGIWANSIAHPICLEKGKTRLLWREMVEGMDRSDANDAWRVYQVVMDGIEKAKAHGYVPSDVKVAKGLCTRDELISHIDEDPNEYAKELIDQLLRESIRRSYLGLIDFNDQIYMPALFGGAFPKFPRIMVDEYQDQSPINHALLARLVKGRLIGVGDPFQNIYGFRGAKSGGMASAVEAYSMTELPLSVSFRCPQAIVEEARWRVPHFQWSKPGGKVTLLEGTVDGPSTFGDDATIICRNNAPLLRMAFRLLSAGHSVSVVGSELGPRLTAIMKKLGPNDMKKAQVIQEIESWREEKLAANSKSASDLADCMRVFADHGHDLGQMVSYAEHLFAQQGSIKLLTGHKSKGLEFDNVFWLDPELCDHREQDRNLAYVITTRSQNKLTMLDSSQILW